MNCNLVIDVGNSTIKLFVVEGFNILHVSNYESISDIDYVFTLFPNIKNGIYSASGKDCEDLKSYLSEKLCKFVVFNHTIPIPITNCYNTPETLGMDRLAGAIGVNHFFPNQNILIFDFGTAITIDFLNSNNFLGGNISPGLLTRFKSLSQFTNKLPLLSKPQVIEDFGKTTTEAIESGIVTGIIGEINYYIQKYGRYKVVFTGGDSFYFAEKIKSPIFVFRNPVVFGLNKVLTYNNGEMSKLWHGSCF